MKMRIGLNLVFFVLSIWSAPALSAEDLPAEGEGRLLSNIRQITFEGKRAGEGYFSADGKMLVFQSERDPANPFFQIFLMDLETGDTRQISPGSGKTTCSWVHPGGKKVLFASTHEDPDAVKKQKEEIEFREKGGRRYGWDYDDYYELYVRDLETNELTRLTNAKGYDAEGSYSPDGKYIAFASNRLAYTSPLSAKEKEIFEKDKSYFLDIYIMRADGSDLRRLTDVPGYDGGPFFSADGTKICWRRFSEDGMKAEIYTMNIDGTDQRQLTRMDVMSWAPYFHPTGDYLVFATNRHGFDNFELYMVDADGKSEPQRVTFTERFDGLPCFSPDGKTLAWTSNRTPSNQSQIFFASWNDENARKLLGLIPSLPTSPEVSASDLRLHVGNLASEEMEGRLTGTEGERKATEYVAGVAKALGLKPAGDGGSYFQSFDFTAGVSLGTGNSLEVSGVDGSVAAAVDQDWRPMAFSKTGTIEEAPVVFAGYGMVAPAEGDNAAYDSFGDLDVKGKWVLVLRYMPEQVSPERRQYLGRYSGIRYKAMAARERGAAGILVASGPNSQVEKQLIDLSFDSSLGTTSIGVLSISDHLASQLLTASSKDLKAVQDAVDGGATVPGFDLGKARIAATIDLKYEKKTGRNVLALLPADQPGNEPELVLGAHLDHLGRGKGMSTLAKDEEKGQIHYGADDNASGTASLIEIAEYLANQKKEGKLPLKRNILFAFWSGEELGLLGSSHFTSALATSIGNQADISSRVAAYINLDMVGRFQEKLIVQGIGSSSVWPSEIEKRNAPIGLPLVTQNDSYLPTDSTSFYLKHVPVLSAFTGTHGEYHSPRDRPETLDYDDMQKIARLMALIGRGLAISADEPDYIEMKRPAEGGGRARLRAYLGTIPDFAQGSDVVGLKISGTAGGGPAAKAGLQGGDVIVELAGRKIESIYDYTYAIEALKIGQPVSIVVMRNGERLTLEIIPGSRE